MSRGEPRRASWVVAAGLFVAFVFRRARYANSCAGARWRADHTHVRSCLVVPECHGNAALMHVAGSYIYTYLAFVIEAFLRNTCLLGWWSCCAVRFIHPLYLFHPSSFSLHHLNSLLIPLPPPFSLILYPSLSLSLILCPATAPFPLLLLVSRSNLGPSPWPLRSHT